MSLNKGSIDARGSVEPVPTSNSFGVLDSSDCVVSDVQATPDCESSDVESVNVEK